MRTLRNIVLGLCYGCESCYAAPVAAIQTGSGTVLSLCRFARGPTNASENSKRTDICHRF